MVFIFNRECEDYHCCIRNLSLVNIISQHMWYSSSKEKWRRPLNTVLLMFKSSMGLIYKIKDISLELSICMAQWRSRALSSCWFGVGLIIWKGHGHHNSGGITRSLLKGVWRSCRWTKRQSQPLQPVTTTAYTGLLQIYNRVLSTCKCHLVLYLVQYSIKNAGAWPNAGLRHERHQSHSCCLCHGPFTPGLNVTGWSSAAIGIWGDQVVENGTLYHRGDRAWVYFPLWLGDVHNFIVVTKEIKLST